MPKVQTETWRRELAATFAAASSEVLYVVRLQPDVAVEFVSPGIVGLLGYVPAEFYADSTLWSSVVDRDAADTVRELTLGDAGEESNGIVRWIAKNGRAVWVHHRWLVVTRDGGSKALYGAARALRSEQRGQDLAGQVDYLRLLLENVTDVVFDIAADDTFRWASPSIEQVLGWRPAELIGKQCSHFIDPETDDEVAARGGDPQRHPAPPRRFRVRTADGGRRWMAGLWRETRDSQGRLLGRIAGLHDIEDTVRAESALASSREHYRLLAENGSDLVFRATPGPKVECEWISPSVAEVLGWQPDELVGQVVTSLMHPDDVAQLGAEHVDPQEDGKGTYELRIRCHDGDFRWMALTVRSLVDESGAIIARVGSARDITSEVEARQQLARSEMRLRLAMESAPSGMAVVDLDWRFVQVNPALCRMVGRDETWLLQHTIDDIFDPADATDNEELREQVLTGDETTLSGEKRLRRADGSTIWVEHAIGVLRDEDGAPASFVCQYVDVTASRRTRDDLAYLADHDPLTCLLTRRALVAGIDTLLAQPDHADSALGVLFIDVDRFKQTNDSYGHAAGDQLLIGVAERINATTRPEDLVARVGGDEIVVVLPGLHGPQGAELVATKIHDALRDGPVSVAGVSMQAEVSIGVALAEPGEDTEHLLHRADLALYAAKQEGRNRTVLYSPGLDRSMR